MNNSVRLLHRSTMLILIGSIPALFAGSLFESKEVTNIYAPPPSVPTQWREAINNRSEIKSFAISPTLFSIGDPTDEEQLYLEFINRARQNPAAEAERFRTTSDQSILSAFQGFSVDLDLMTQQFATIAPASAVAMNARLTAAARLHSRDMLQQAFQGHTGSDGSSMGSRVTSQGYVWMGLGENVFARAKSIWQGHAAFEVDWGGTPETGGMQSPPGHRETIHDPNFREVGIGIIEGINGNVGPQVVTQDFGTAQNATPFITGVIYFDLNNNQFYDAGEGIGGVNVTAPGTTFYTRSAGSGGYALPVPGNGTYNVTFEIPGSTSVAMSAVVENKNNVKVDVTPSYSAPVISGPVEIPLLQPVAFQITPVPAAKVYEVRSTRGLAFTQVEGAESGTANVIATVDTNYSVIENTIKAAGSHSFHLAHPTAQNQSIELDRTLQPSTTSQLMFASRLGWASDKQIARAQISIDQGKTWTELWSRVGTGDSGQTQFSAQTVSLSRFAGEAVRIRFLYEFLGGQFFDQTAAGVGFYLDEIRVTNAEEIIGESITDLGQSRTLAFTAPVATSYSLSARAKVGNNFLPWGPVKRVVASDSAVLPTQVRITHIQKNGTGQLQMDFETSSVGAGTYIVQSAGQIRGPWTQDRTATVQALSDGTQFRALVSTDSSGAKFYRLAASGL
jgi:uncharacterized protein YkwD